jgi:TonB family protein
VIAAVLALGGYLAWRSARPPQNASATGTTTAPAVAGGATSPAPAAAAAGAASTASPPAAAVDALVAAELEKRKQEMADTFAQEQKALQEQLAKTAASDEARKRAQAELEAKQKADAERLAKEQAEAERLAQERAEAERLAREEEARRAAQVEEERRAAEAAAAAPPEPEPAAQQAEPAQREPEPQPAVAAPSVREGDLVQPGSGVLPPVLVSIDKPEYPPIARRMRVQGTVTLSLLVDENGNVTETKITTPVPQNVGINEAAVAAARTAKFRPATKEGVRVKMWYKLNLPFKL